MSNTDLRYALRHGVSWTAPAIAGRLVVIALLAAAPFVLNNYQISTASRMLVFGLLAISATLLTGVTGLPTLGQAAYFGVGAYTAAIIARDVTAIGPVQVLIAAVAAAIVAMFTGTLAARARGVPFLMITLAIGEIARSAAVSWSSLTGGSDGLSGIPRVVPLPGMGELTLDGLVYYYVLVMALIAYLLARALARSPFGLVLRGIRDNEDRLRALGYPTGRYVLAGFTVAGGLAGAAGALLVSVQRFVSPGDVGFAVSAVALLAAIIGGVGSLPGAMAGAALVVLVRDYIGTDLGGHGPLLVGAMFVTVVYLMPQGMAGIEAQLRRRIPRPRDRGAP
jgi:branched-chain amino acid transport system permease protein